MVNYHTANVKKSSGRDYKKFPFGQKLPKTIN